MNRRDDELLQEVCRLLFALDCPAGISALLTSCVNNILEDNQWIEETYKSGDRICAGWLQCAIERRLMRLRAIAEQRPRIIRESEDPHWLPVREQLDADIERLQAVDPTWAAIARGEVGSAEPLADWDEDD